MNTRKNQILSMLIVGVLTTIGIGATEASAQITVGIRARMSHPTLATPINLGGVGNINVVAGSIAPGTFDLVDATGGPASAQISWSTGTVDSFGRFRVEGQAYGKWVDATGVTRYVHFRMVIRGRTNGTHVRARFGETAGTPGARLRGRCRG
jgi:hypothetical protein